MPAKGEWRKVLDIIRKVIRTEQPAFLLEVAMFSLPQGFSIFQHSRLFIINKSDKGHSRSSIYFLLARDNVGGC
jgi:hypothetical protein